MKKIIFFVLTVCLLGGSLPVFSDDIILGDKKQEFTFSYGYLSVPSYAGALIQALISIPFVTSSKDMSIDSSIMTGTFSLGYLYHFAEHFSVGGCLAYEKNGQSWVSATDTSLNFDSSIRVASIMGQINADYGWEKFRFYHSLKVGAALFSCQASNADFNPIQPCFACHITALGLQFLPRDDLSIFLDAGFGFLGIVNAGISYKF